MSDNRHRTFFLVLTGCVLYSFLFSCHQKSGEVLIADYIVNGQFTSNQDSLEIRHLVDTLLEQTFWSGKIRINKSYDPASVNIYILNGDALKIREDGVVSQLTSNCSFVGYNIVFIDDAFLRSFLANHHVVKDTHNNELMDDQECFLYWVIGHELGHLVCGHLSGHFDTGPLDSFVKSSTLQNRDEMQADSFFVHVIVPKKILRISEERLMMNILNAEIEQKVGKIRTLGVGIIYDYTNKQVVSYARQPTHPEYVIRLSRMLELSAKASADTGMYNLVSGFIKQLKEVNKN